MKLVLLWISLALALLAEAKRDNGGGGFGSQICVPKVCKPFEKAVARPNYTPTSNGCGSGGFRLTASPEFTECCHQHDICYGQW